MVAATIYGFRGCDTVKKALNWLDTNNVTHEFFDYRKQQLDPHTVSDWFERAGWENVLNRNSTSFKALSDAQEAALDAARAKDMILTDTNLIKRPVLDTGDDLLFGFRADAYARATGK
jgi:arsenate reductase (glutaredoxin)